AHLVHGDDEHLRGALESVGEAGRIGEVAVPHPYPLGRERLHPARVAHADADLMRWHPRQQPLDDKAAEMSVGAGNDDHGVLHQFDSSGNKIRVSLIITMESNSMYR